VLFAAMDSGIAVIAFLGVFLALIPHGNSTDRRRH
jgi:hypothetical protein